ncbi:uncharacterized protein LOC123007936 [Tribolium madens]|uniref:uncharacterized protein LOC123007936 n=1 Tax=Tribolium madens TaxID=41895 RepID=UPI001CF73EE5|nr:uncharacterized protein LOC123007936 [Tribolium madens]
MQAPVVESGVQLFSRLNKSQFCLEDVNPKLFQGGSPRPNDIVEVTGDFSTDLLVDFLVRCILPKELNQYWKESGVVFVNTTFHISVLKITNTIDAHLKNLKIKNRKSLIEKALTFVTFLNCYDEEQFETTLRNLEKMIQDKDNCSLLIIDDITSQFWVAKQKNSILSYDQFSRNIFSLLQSVVKNLNLVSIFCRHQVGSLKKPVDLQVDYKIIGEELDSKKQFVVIDYGRKITTRVTFNLDSFITFL